FDIAILRYFTEPLLMPFIIIWFLKQTTLKSRQSYYILSSLIFSWIGDIFMMFNDELNLLFGIAFFVSTHIIYILFLSNIPASDKSYFREKPILLLVVFVYLIEMLYILWPYLEGLKVPVLIYSILISIMMLLAMWQYKRISNRASLALITGAWLFVLSDTVNAVYKFRFPFTWGMELVQITYVAGQVLLVLGYLNLVKEQAHNN
ncbi:MAG: lysoplasmalogenase, partial [Chitinophagaceae bacterium]